MTAVLVISGMLVAQNAIATEITVQASKSATVKGGQEFTLKAADKIAGLKPLDKAPAKKRAKKRTKRARSGWTGWRKS